MYFLGKRIEASAFNEFANTYAQVRPSYPSVIFSEVINACNINENSKVLEIGAGTGIATSELAKTGCDCIAIEPGEHLLEIAKERLSSFPNVKLELNSFEDYQTNSQFDVILAATAFHWLTPEERFKRTSDLLRSGGALVLIWNTFCFSNTEAASAVIELYNNWFPSQHDDQPNMKALRKLMGRELEIQQSSFFYIESTLRAVTQYTYSAQDYAHLLKTFPNIARMDEDERTKFLSEITSLLDKMGGKLIVPVLTSSFICRRLQDFSEIIGNPLNFSS